MARSKKKSGAKDKPAPKPRHLGLEGVTAQLPPQLDGETVSLLTEYVYLAAGLRDELSLAEHAAAQGERREFGSGGSGARADLAGRLEPGWVDQHGQLHTRIADYQGDAEALRKLDARRKARLRRTVHALKVDLGLELPERGPRDANGRLRILSESYVS